MTVKRGDTLSGIAEEELGDADRYPEIFRASKTITQPGNRHLTDPDVIDVGWTLKHPRRGAKRQTPAKPTNPGNGHRTTHDDQRRTLGTAPTPEPTARASPPHHRLPPPPPGRPNLPRSRRLRSPRPMRLRIRHKPIAESSPWLLTGLTGGGAVLAGIAAAAAANPPPQPVPQPSTRPNHRRPRLRSSPRSRRPSPPSATLSAPRIDIRGRGTPPPRGHAKPPTSSQCRRSPRSSCPAAPSGCTSAGRSTCRSPGRTPTTSAGPYRSTSTSTSSDPHVVDQPAPYPLLVTIGTDDDDQVWLLNCEELAVASITGDPTYSADFARYLAAELACNPWSDAVTVDCVGVASEVTALNPDRVHTHPAGNGSGRGTPRRRHRHHRTGWRRRAWRRDRPRPTARRRQLAGPAAADRPHRPATGSLDQLISLLQEHHGRTGTAVATVGHHTNPGGVVIDLTSHGRLRVPSLGLDLVAVGLTADEALGCAALLAQSTADAPDVPIPQQIDADGWHAYADEAGALRTEHTQSRGTPPDPRRRPHHLGLAARRRRLPPRRGHHHPRSRHPRPPGARRAPAGHRKRRPNPRRRHQDLVRRGLRPASADPARPGRGPHPRHRHRQTQALLHRAAQPTWPPDPTAPPPKRSPTPSPSPDRGSATTSRCSATGSA